MVSGLPPSVGSRNRLESHCSLRHRLLAGLAYLVRAQHPAGSWTDFWLPVGTSDAWVTAYVGLALQSAAVCELLPSAARAIADRAARRAATWLLAQDRGYPGWGYNATVPVDADSTAHALLLLARLGNDIPRAAIDLLWRHEEPGIGFRTYVRSDREHRWGYPSADVTAAALRALYDCGALDTANLRIKWDTMLGGAQDARGWWNGDWWPTPNYTTGLALEVWRAAGCPELRVSPDPDLPDETPFDRAWAVLVAARCDDLSAVACRAASILTAQQTDGSWQGGAILRVPPSHPRRHGDAQPLLARDERRLFTTATTLRALVEAWRADASLLEGAARSRPTARRHSLSRSTLGSDLDALIASAADAISFDAAAAATARHQFASLTRASLRTPCAWPSPQLSSLADGIPLEFSATVGRDVRPTLRYATEIGDPVGNPYRRARTGVEALARTAADLGYDRAWTRIAPAVADLVSPALSVPDGLRFWIWGGMDQVAPVPGQSAPPMLKIYLNLLNRELDGARSRLESALRATAIPLSAALRDALDWLDETGFIHEIGFGLGPDGKIACKVYYELRGWQPSLVQQILKRAGLPTELDAIRPEIPGILSESLAAKSRAGIALRLDSGTGAIREVTVAAAFPPALLPRKQICFKVQEWIADHDWDGSSYIGLVGILLPIWEVHGGSNRRLHSLLTRTVSSNTSWSAIYLRPYIRRDCKTPANDVIADTGLNLR